MNDKTNKDIFPQDEEQNSLSAPKKNDIYYNYESRTHLFGEESICEEESISSLYTDEKNSSILLEDRAETKPKELECLFLSILTLIVIVLWS